MVTQIGIVAGEILNYLDENGIVSLEEIIKRIKKPDKLILMSLGWLARENHIVVNQKEDKYIVGLRKKECIVKNDLPS